MMISGKITRSSRVWTIISVKLTLKLAGMTCHSSKDISLKLEPFHIGCCMLWVAIAMRFRLESSKEVIWSTNLHILVEVDVITRRYLFREYVNGNAKSLLFDYILLRLLSIVFKSIIDFESKWEYLGCKYINYYW